jgi:hypothetical protein
MPLRNPKHRQEGDIKTALKKICCEDTNEIGTAGVCGDTDVHQDVIKYFYRAFKGSPVPVSRLSFCEQVAGIYT